MSGIIRLSLNNSSKTNNPPSIRNFRQEGKIESDSFDVKYIAEDFENTILHHYIYIDGKKQEISKAVGYESTNNEFTYKVNNLNVNTKYSIQIEVTDGLETVRSDTISITTENYQIYGVRVMENNSNPETCCTYIENAVGVSKATPTSLGGWADKYPFNKIRMVGFKAGRVTKEVNPKNKTKYIDGTNVPTDVDVMVEIPKVYWYFKNITNGYEIRICNKKINNNYKCYAHSINNVEKDFIYIGAYLGNSENGKLRSRSGINPATSISLAGFRNLAKANGNGYTIFNYFSVLLLQILYLILYKNLDSQTAFGMGVCNSSSKFNTGGTNTKGLIYGSTMSNQVSFLGIEDFYGNFYQIIDGIQAKSGYFYVLFDNKNFDNASLYTIDDAAVVYSGYTSKVFHTDTLGFIGVKSNGSQTTYYSDYFNTNSGTSVLKFGGRYNDQRYVGVFNMQFTLGISDTGGGLTTRLCYLG